MFQTVGLKQGQPSGGFQAVHDRTSLTEIVSYYWKTLSNLGFVASVENSSREVVSYTFKDGDRQLKAIFTQQGDHIIADVSWAQPKLTSSANYTLTGSTR